MAQRAPLVFGKLKSASEFESEAKHTGPSRYLPLPFPLRPWSLLIHIHAAEQCIERLKGAIGLDEGGSRNRSATNHVSPYTFLLGHRAYGLQLVATVAGSSCAG